MNDPLPLDPTRGHFKDSLVRQWSYTGSAQPSHPNCPLHPLHAQIEASPLATRQGACAIVASSGGQSAHMRTRTFARQHARALTCERRCRGCASRAYPECSSRRRSSDAASGEEAGAWSRADVRTRRGLAPPAAAPIRAALAFRVSPGPISPQPLPSRSS